jgi:branched-chain amino acid transport system permease protein
MVLLLLIIRFQPGGLLGEGSLARRLIAKVLPGKPNSLIALLK